MINLCSLTPVISVITLSFVSIIITFFTNIDFLVSYMGFSQVLINTTVILSVVVLRFTQPDLPRPIRVFKKV